VIAYGQGMILQLVTDRDLFESLERLEELVADLRALISTRARGESGP